MEPLERSTGRNRHQVRLVPTLVSTRAGLAPALTTLAVDLSGEGKTYGSDSAGSAGLSRGSQKYPDLLRRFFPTGPGVRACAGIDGRLALHLAQSSGAYFY